MFFPYLLFICICFFLNVRTSITLECLCVNSTGNLLIKYCQCLCVNSTGNLLIKYCQCLCVNSTGNLLIKYCQCLGVNSTGNLLIKYCQCLCVNSTGNLLINYCQCLCVNSTSNLLIKYCQCLCVNSTGNLLIKYCQCLCVNSTGNLLIKYCQCLCVNSTGNLLKWTLSVLGLSYLLMFATAFSCIPRTGWLSITSTVICLAVVGYVTEEVKGLTLCRLYRVRYLKWTMIKTRVPVVLKMKSSRWSWCVTTFVQLVEYCWQVLIKIVWGRN